MGNKQKEVLEWAEKRNLLVADNAPKQMLKVVEEVGELCRAILKNNISEQIDAIGDIQVTLIILSRQLRIDYDGALDTAYEVIKNRTGKTVDGTFIKDGN